MMDTKLELIESLIYLIGNQKLRIDLSNVINNRFANHKKYIFNPFFIKCIIFILIIFANILILNNRDLYYSKLMCDFSYNWDFGIQYKIISIYGMILVLMIEINNYFNYKNMRISKIISNDLQTIRYKPRYLSQFKKINKLINILGLIFGINLGLFAFIYSFEFNYLIIFGIFWATVYITVCIQYMNTIFWNLLSFILYCIRSRILLNIENKRLIQIILKNKHLINKSLFDQLKRFDIIYSNINNWNKIWCNFIAINIANYSLIISFLSLIIFFGKNINISIEMFLIFMIIIGLISITSVILIASSVNTESKITHKLFNNVFILNSKKKWKYFKSVIQMIKVYKLYLNYIGRYIIFN